MQTDLYTLMTNPFFLESRLNEARSLSSEFYEDEEEETKHPHFHTVEYREPKEEE